MKITLALLFFIVITAGVQAQTNTIIEKPKPKWESSASVGGTVTGGNTKTVLVTANFQSQRKTPDNEFLMGGDGAYGKDDTTGTGIKSAESLHGFGQYNRLATDRLYYGFRLDGLHDAVAGVNYRYTLSPLLGYYLVKSTNSMLATEFGPGYVYQRRTGATPKGYATLRLAERYEYKISSTARLWQNLEIIPRIERFTDYYLNGEIGVDTTLTKHASLTTYLQDTYYNVPTPGRLKNDYKLVAGIKYLF